MSSSMLLSTVAIGSPENEPAEREDNRDDVLVESGGGEGGADDERRAISFFRGEPI